MSADVLNFPGCADTEPALVPDFVRGLGYVLVLDQLHPMARRHVMAIWADTGNISAEEYAVLQAYYKMKETPA